LVVIAFVDDKKKNYPFVRRKAGIPGDKGLIRRLERPK